MILGQVGFFDQFTVSMSRNAQAMAVEVWDTFDRRFGIGLAKLQICDRELALDRKSGCGQIGWF